MNDGNYHVITEDKTDFHLDEDTISSIPTLNEYFLVNKQKSAYETKLLTNTLSNVVTYIKFNKIHNDKEVKDFNNNMLQNMNLDIFFDLIIACKELQLPDLLNMCKKHFRIILAKRPEMIRKIYSLEE